MDISSSSRGGEPNFASMDKEELEAFFRNEIQPQIKRAQRGEIDGNSMKAVDRQLLALGDSWSRLVDGLLEKSPDSVQELEGTIDEMNHALRVLEGVISRHDRQLQVLLSVPKDMGAKFDWLSKSGGAELSALAGMGREYIAQLERGCAGDVTDADIKQLEKLYERAFEINRVIDVLRERDPAGKSRIVLRIARMIAELPEDQQRSILDISERYIDSVEQIRRQKVIDDAVLPLERILKSIKQLNQPLLDALIRACERHIEAFRAGEIGVLIRWHEVGDIKVCLTENRERFGQPWVDLASYILNTVPGEALEERGFAQHSASVLSVLDGLSHIASAVPESVRERFIQDMLETVRGREWRDIDNDTFIRSLRYWSEAVAFFESVPLSPEQPGYERQQAAMQAFGWLGISREAAQVALRGSLHQPLLNRSSAILAYPEGFVQRFGYIQDLEGSDREKAEFLCGFYGHHSREEVRQNYGEWYEAEQARLAMEPDSKEPEA